MPRDRPPGPCRGTAPTWDPANRRWTRRTTSERPGPHGCSGQSADGLDDEDGSIDATTDAPPVVGQGVPDQVPRVPKPAETVGPHSHDGQNAMPDAAGRGCSRRTPLGACT